MKKTFIIALLCAIAVSLKAQVNPVGQFLDEHNLVLYTGTTVVSDATAYGGNAICRLSSSGSTTIWFGPYAHLQGGNYLLQIRLKVTSNTSSSFLFGIDMVDNFGGTIYGALNIYPNMFRNSNVWQIFTIPINIPDNNNVVEIRGVNFQSGITDMYLDYVNIVPGDARGFYSNEFTIAGNGAVGVNTSYIPPGFQFAINGNTIAASITVQDRASWPDYVFKKGYSLTPLPYVRTYIDQNHHLPDIPSAADVKRNGLNLGDMNTILVKKIEELTLYLLEKDKQVNELKSKLGAQDRQLQKQQDELKSIKKILDRLAKKTGK